VKQICTVGLFLLCSGTLSAASTLAERYEQLSCAVVRIEGPNNMVGTGFFVNRNGLLVTAAHVLFDRTFRQQGNQVQIVLSYHRPSSVVFQNSGKKLLPEPTLTQRDSDNAIFDVAAIETGLSTDCFISIGKPELLKVGEHLISIGFPGSANSGVLYEGFLSAKHTQVPTIVGAVEGTNQFRTISRDIFRVQMPITAGASGSPVIADDDKAVGIISEIPIIWTTQLARFVEAASKGDIGTIRMGGFDTNQLLAQLALIVKEFESPGAGLAVPISYLKLPPTTSPQKP
jgi:S1-C subfamily serine protease